MIGEVDMANFKALEMIQYLKELSDIDKTKKAQSSNEIKEEIKNVLEDTKVLLYRQTREDAIKYVLWQGLLNQYGIFGTKRSYKREFGKEKICYYNQSYLHGDLVSIDFGTSNVGSEFSFTHTALVMHDYTDYLIVIPITSCKEGRLENKPNDEQLSTIIIEKDKFKFIESDSYILLYQIRSICKNRITKRIGSIANSEILELIDYKIFELLLNPIFKIYNNEVTTLYEKLSEREKTITELSEKLNNIKNIVE